MTCTVDHLGDDDIPEIKETLKDSQFTDLEIDEFLSGKIMGRDEKDTESGKIARFTWELIK